MSAQHTPLLSDSMTVADIERVIESCRDRLGDLNDDGRYIAYCLRKTHEWAAYRMTEASADALAAAKSSAFNVKAAIESLRKSCRVPVTMLATMRAGNRRRAALAKAGAA